MIVIEGDRLGNYTSVKKIDEIKPPDAAELILSKSSGDATHYVYFRVEELEVVKVVSMGFGAETTFTKYEDLVGMNEHLSYLLFQDNYTVIGGSWRNTVSADFNIVEEI